MAAEALPLSIGAALATVYFRADSVMLSQLDTFESVAIYGVSYKFVELAHFVPTAVAIPTLTLLVASWPDAVDRFRDTFDRALAFLALLAGLVLVEFAWYADEITDLLYGAEYTAGAGATRVLLVAESLGFFSALIFTALTAAGRHRVYPLITFTGLVVNVALNFALIGPYSFKGAAVATLVTDAMVLALMAVQYRKLVGAPSIHGALLARLAGGALLALGAGWVLHRWLPFLVGASALVLVYLGAAQVTVTWGNREDPGGLRALLGDRQRD